MDDVFITRLSNKENELKELGRQINQEFEIKRNEMKELETYYVQITGQLQLIKELLEEPNEPLMNENIGVGSDE